MHALEQQLLPHSSLMVVIGLGFVTYELFCLSTVECLQTGLQIYSVTLGLVFVLVGLVQGDFDVSKSFYKSAQALSGED